MWPHRVSATAVSLAASLNAIAESRQVGFCSPLPREARQALLAGEQFLHGALFDVALLGEELLQGLDEGIRIAQRLGDGFLFGFGGREAES